MVPMAAFTMAGIVIVYIRSSIRAAKLNVEKRKEEGGGRVDWGLQSQRNHGLAERIDTVTTKKEAMFGQSKATKEKRDENGP
jgi:hypothetical protein